MTRKLNKRRLGVLLMLCFLAGVGTWCDYAKRAKDLAAKDITIAALQHTVVQYRNQYGQQVSTTGAIVASRENLLSLHAADSSEIKRLQGLVGKKTTAATILNTITTQTIGGKTEVVYVGDSTRPVYSHTVCDAWGTFSIQSRYDSTFLRYKTINKYDFTDQVEKTGKWPNRREFLSTTVTNLNPNTITTGLAAYRRPLPTHKKRNAVAVIGVFIAGVATGIKLAK